MGPENLVPARERLDRKGESGELTELRRICKHAETSKRILRGERSRVGLKSDFSETTKKKDEDLFQLLLTRNTDQREVSFLSLNSHEACAIYNDKKVVEIFELKMWISASKEDDMIKSGELSTLLQRSLVGKKFLLMIDDVWNQKEERDMFFKNCSIMNGKKGSKVILITCATEITDLPDFILQKFFCKLPIKTVLGCKCVSKEWCKLIKDPNFPKLHLAEATFCPILRTIEPSFWPSDLHMIEVNNTNDLAPPMKLHSKLLPPQVPLIQVPGEFAIPKFGIVNSCNGLLCVCTSPFNNPIYVCNPITGEYIMLPKPERNPNTDDYIMGEEMKGELYRTGFVVSGFGFSQETNKYKVLRVFDMGTNDDDQLYETIVQVLTHGSSSWRTLGTLNQWKDIGLRVSRRQTLFPTEASYRSSFCVYLNGAVHWLANHKSSPLFICSFNFDKELLIEILPPYGFVDEDHAVGNMRLGVLDDCLYITDIICYVHFNLWVLKDYNDLYSWTKVLVISNISLNTWPRGFYRPIKYLENGELLMFHPSNALVCYNPKDQSFRYFKIRGFDSDFEMVPHIPSLVSMRDAISLEDSQVEIDNYNYPKTEARQDPFAAELKKFGNQEKMFDNKAS